jgi:hypothetical protein
LRIGKEIYNNGDRKEGTYFQNLNIENGKVMERDKNNRGHILTKSFTFIELGNPITRLAPKKISGQPKLPITSPSL